jgi:hypothetical protein
MTAIFPALPGLGWSVTKAARFATRIQRAVTTPPPSGQAITADFTYWFRVRFADDTAEFENFMYQLWQSKQIKLQSVFL